MNDNDELQNALDNDATIESNNKFSGMMNSLTRSMAFALQEFYNNLIYQNVSSITGDGFDKLFNKIEESNDE